MLSDLQAPFRETTGMLLQKVFLFSTLATEPSILAVPNLLFFTLEQGVCHTSNTTSKILIQTFYLWQPYTAARGLRTNGNLLE